MATLHCRFCAYAIDSNARCAQCSECRALFPFECASCGRNLRPPFSVFDDERHLTLDIEPLPLCVDHFLRQCPDCLKWYQNDENPGFFRCLDCTRNAPQVPLSPDWSEDSSEVTTSIKLTTALNPATVPRARLRLRLRVGMDPNALILSAAGFAFVALMGWVLLGR